MIEHIVLIRWKEGTSREQVDAVLALARIMEGIDGVRGVSCRPKLGSNGRDKGIADVMVVRMADEAALARFGPHPLHKEFGARMVPLVEDLTIVDVMATDG